MNHEACTFQQLIHKLHRLNFHGPIEFGDFKFMCYNGQALLLPDAEMLTIAQFRFLLTQINSIVSEEEWDN